METKEQTLKHYVRRSAECPYLKWFEKLRDKRAQVRIDARLARVRAGNFGNAHGVGEGVQELVIDYGPGYRVYYGRDGDEVVILLGGGDKSTQDKDIALAKECWADYRAQKTEE